MKTRKYLITNNSEGSICITGRQRIDIPGRCKDLPLALPENTARQTILRLKQRYPLLKITEVQEDKPQAPASKAAKPETNTDAGGIATAANSGEAVNNTDNAAKTDDDKGGIDATAQAPAATQKADSKKGK